MSRIERPHRSELVNPGAAPTLAHRQVKAVSFGLVGQLLNFIALIFPVAVASEQNLVHLVFVSSICTASFASATLANPMRYPSIRNDRAAGVALKASITALSVISATFIVIGGLVLAVGAGSGGFLIAIGALLLFQGGDNLLISWMVRADNATGIGQNRFRYGLVNVVVTPLVALLWEWRWSLVVAACAVYGSAILWVGWTHRSRLVLSLRDAASASHGSSLAYIRGSAVPVGSYLLNGLGSQAAGIVLGAVGIFAAPWAVIMRIAGGFSTLSLQLVAPAFDARIGKSVRDADYQDAFVAVRKGLMIGIPLSIAGTGAAFGVLFASDRGSSLRTNQWITLVLCVLLYWGSSLALSPVWKTLTLVGAHGGRLAWDGARAAAVLLAILTLRGGELLLVLSGVIASFNLVMTGAALRVTAKRIRTTYPGRAANLPALGQQAAVVAGRPT